MKQGHINPLLSLLNCAFVLGSIALLGVGIWLAHNHNTKCVHFLQTVLIGVGLFMLPVALAGLIGSHFRVPCLIYLNFTVMLLLLIVLTGATAFVLVVTSQAGASDKYSTGWLLNQVSRKTKSCTRDGEICKFVNESSTASSYNKAGLSSLQAGCCEPPAACNINGTRESGTTSSIQQQQLQDCEAWSQISSSMGFCSDCNSCKAAVAKNISHVWHQVAIFKVIVLLLLIPCYFLSFCCFKSEENHGDSREERCQECLNCVFSCCI